MEHPQPIRIQDAAGNYTSPVPPSSPALQNIDLSFTVLDSFDVAPAPTISGTTRVGYTLTANPGTWSPAAALAYQWKRNGAAISGATGATYLLDSASAGTSITVSVTGTKAGYTTTAKTSTAVSVPTIAFTTTPTPTITGTPGVGKTLTANPGTWSPAAALAYQWKPTAPPISGATGATYLLDSASAGTSITVSVTGTKAGYTTTAKTSTAVSVPTIAFTTTPTPTITGTPGVGKTLTANPGTWSPAAALAYQWKRNGVAISGATGGTYLLVSASTGTTLTVTVTGTKAGYTTTAKT